MEARPLMAAGPILSRYCRTPLPIRRFTDDLSRRAHRRRDLEAADVLPRSARLVVRVLPARRAAGRVAPGDGVHVDDAAGRRSRAARTRGPGGLFLLHWPVGLQSLP